MNKHVGTIKKALHEYLDTAHDEDESYPVNELEDRNTVLQRLVDEKTK